MQRFSLPDRIHYECNNNHVEKFIKGVNGFLRNKVRVPLYLLPEAISILYTGKYCVLLVGNVYGLSGTYA